MNVLVTGATGFLGTALSAALERAGHSVVRLSSRNCDLRRDGALDAFAGEAYDQIFHLAAWTQAGDFCLYHPGEQWVINQKINTSVLAFWQAVQPQAKLITIGTSCAYAPDRDLVEENYLEGQPIESLFTYAYTKRMLEVGVRALHRQYGLRYLTVVPSTLYGPGYHADDRQMHFIFDLIRKILRGKMLDEPVVLWGDGHQKRELVYVDDFVSILLRLSVTVDNDLVNIGAGEEHSIREFAGIICDEVGFDPGKIQYDTARYVGATSKFLGTAKLRAKVHDLSLTPLRDGLRRTIRAFEAEQRQRLQPAGSATS